MSPPTNWLTDWLTQSLSQPVKNLLTHRTYQHTKCSWKFCFQVICPPIWDGASCFPPTPAGHTAVLPCMDNFDGTFYSPKCISNICNNRICIRICKYCNDCTENFDEPSILQNVSPHLFLGGRYWNNVVASLQICGIPATNQQLSQSSYLLGGRYWNNVYNKLSNMSSVEIPLKPMKSQQLTSNCDDQTTLQKSASPMEAGAGQRITMTACARYFYSFSFLHRCDAF